MDVSPRLVLRPRLLNRVMGPTCAAVGLILLVGGVVASTRGQGLDNLIVSGAGLLFGVIGLDLWWGHVSVTGQHLRVHRLRHGRLFTRDEIERVEVGDAVGMMMAGQRTLVLHAHAEPFYINPLARYASLKSEQLLSRQRDAVVATLHVDDR